MSAAVSPGNASNQSVTWSVAQGTGNATIDGDGLLTAVADGTVTVVATAQDGSGVTGELEITITNQVIPPVGMTVNAPATLTFTVGEFKEFDINIQGNDDTGKDVSAEFNTPEGTTLEFEHSDGVWVQIFRHFPAGPGSYFEVLADDTTRFRAKLEHVGLYAIDVTFRDKATDAPIASTTIQVEVLGSGGAEPCFIADVYTSPNTFTEVEVGSPLFIISFKATNQGDQSSEQEWEWIYELYDGNGLLKHGGSDFETIELDSGESSIKSRGFEMHNTSAWHQGEAAPGDYFLFTSKTRCDEAILRIDVVGSSPP